MATANDGISRFADSSVYGSPTFQNGIVSSSVTSSGTESFTISSASGFTLSGNQAGMEQTFTVSTILPEAPMFFLGVYRCLPAVATTITLPLTHYDGTRAIFQVNTNVTIQRPAAATYGINGGASFTVLADGYYLLTALSETSYGIFQIS